MTSSLNEQLPDVYDDIQDTLESAKLILTDAVPNAKTLFHTPVVSLSNGRDISSRVMVLREFDLDKRILRFHTDNRAAKIQVINESNLASVVGYDPDLKVQIKMTGNVDVHIKDKVTEDAWSESTSRSKKCYSVKDGSSHKAEKPEIYDFHMKDIKLEDGYANFCTIEFNYHSLEFLYLQRQGHRRCKFNWNSKGKLSSVWLVP